MPRDYGVLVKNIRCVVSSCSRLVVVAVEGTDDDLTVLCRFHKDEVSFLRNQLQNKSNLEQDFRTENQNLKNSLTLKDKELKELAGQIRALESQLTEQENNSSLLKLVKKKLNE
jgi:hypothetical protein